MRMRIVVVYCSPCSNGSESVKLYALCEHVSSYQKRMRLPEGCCWGKSEHTRCGCMRVVCLPYPCSWDSLLVKIWSIIINILLHELVVGYGETFHSHATFSLAFGSWKYSMLVKYLAISHSNSCNKIYILLLCYPLWTMIFISKDCMLLLWAFKWYCSRHPQTWTCFLTSNL